MYLNLDLFYLSLQPPYEKINDSAYMSLILPINDNNRTYAELNSAEANSETTERSQEPRYLEPVTTTSYQNTLEMTAYANT